MGAELVPFKIGKREFRVSRTDAQVIHHIRAKLHLGDVKGAHTVWMGLLDSAKYAPTRERALEIGAELGLYEPHVMARQAEELERYAKLTECPMHVFDCKGFERVAGQIPQRLTCVMCSQWMPTMEAVAYARGFAAAGGDPSVVIDKFVA